MKKLKISQAQIQLIIAAVVIAVLMVACSLTPQAIPTPTPEAPPPAPPTQEPKSLPTETVDDSPTSLPGALYLLSSSSGEIFQVWRISQDRNEITQLTSEPETVEDFAVNPVTGQVAYITNNQIYLINADTSGRTMLLDGGGQGEESDDFYFRQRITGLSFSNDGTQLAYGQNGLNIYTLADHTSQNIIENELEDQDDFIFPRAIYSPLSWSPDGSLMLVDIGFYEGSTIGVYSPDSGEVTRLGEGMVCCHPAWSPDSRSILVASPYIGMIDPGLWRYDVSTGVGTELVPSTSSENTLNFAGWPIALQDGQLQYFFGGAVDFPSGEVPLLMVKSDQDGQTNRTTIREEEWLNYDVLWSPDGSLAITVQPTPGAEAGWPRTGPVVLVPASDDAVIPLGINGYHLQWGP